jgi:branched-chain amino acid transport system ATP-binding protein
MLTVEGLEKYFGRFKAIDRVSFQINESEIVSLIGSNGAGKTTLVNLISGHLRPNGGKVIFEGRDITRSSPYVRIKMGIARSFQVVQIFEGMTVLDNVRTALFSKHGKIRNGLLPADKYSDITKEALWILELFNISDEKDFVAKDLGEGDKKILDIVIAFALKSKLLLLDEPTSGVATGDKFKVMDTIVSALRESKISALIIEHDMDIVSNYSDRILVMHEGKLIAEGMPDEIMGNKDVQATILGVSD